MALTLVQEMACLRAIDVFGREKQWDMVQEECGELVAVVNQSKRGRCSPEKLAGEVADVIIMAEQARRLAGVELVDRMVEEKVERLRTRMDATEKTETPVEDQPTLIANLTRIFDAGCVSVTVRRLPDVALPEGRVRPWSVVATREDGSHREGISSEPGPEALPTLVDFVYDLLQRAD